MLSPRYLTLPVALFAGVWLSGCEIGEASAAQNQETVLPIPVEVAFPQRQTMSETYATTSTISTDMDAPAIAKVGGEVVAIHVEEGEFVKKGQILASLDGERLRLEMLRAKADLERAERQYDRNQDLHDRGLISASMYDGMRFDLEALQAKYDLAALLYDDSNIRSPIAGVVAERTIKLGQNLRVNDQAYRIANTSNLLAKLKIPQSELNKFSPGNLVKLQVASFPDAEFVATVGRISPTIDKTNGTFRVTALIDNTEGLLAPGMFARVVIAFRDRKDALTIPSEAIVEEDNEKVVYVVKASEVSRRIVETGIEQGNKTEILTGLEPHEGVVVVGQSSLSDGSEVLAQTVSEENFTG